MTDDCNKKWNSPCPALCQTRAVKKSWRRPTLPADASTIGAEGLNFPVRNGKGWAPSQWPPTALCARPPFVGAVPLSFGSFGYVNDDDDGGRGVRKGIRQGRQGRPAAHAEIKKEAFGQLVPLGSNASLRFHLRPIDVVFSHGPPVPKDMERSSRGRLRT